MRGPLSSKPSLTHGFLINMGGFCLKSSSGHYHQLNWENISLAIASSDASGAGDLPLADDNGNDLRRKSELPNTKIGRAAETPNHNDPVMKSRELENPRSAEATTQSQNLKALCRRTHTRNGWTGSARFRRMN